MKSNAMYASPSGSRAKHTQPLFASTSAGSIDFTSLKSARVRSSPTSTARVATTASRISASSSSRTATGPPGGISTTIFRTLSGVRSSSRAATSGPTHNSHMCSNSVSTACGSRPASPSVREQPRQAPTRPLTASTGSSQTRWNRGRPTLSTPLGFGVNMKPSGQLVSRGLRGGLGCRSTQASPSGRAWLPTRATQMGWSRNAPAWAHAARGGPQSSLLDFFANRVRAISRTPLPG